MPNFLTMKFNKLFLICILYLNFTVLHGQVCEKASEINLGDSCLIRSSTINQKNDVSFYDCRPEDTYPGREKIFKFTVKERCNLQVALFIQGSRNLDIFLFKYYCGGIFSPPDNDIRKNYMTCLYGSARSNFSGPNQSFSIIVEPGEYFISIDSENQGEVGDFILDITCGSLSCTNCTEIFCNKKVNGSTIGLTNNSSIYRYAYLFLGSTPDTINDLYNVGPEKLYCFKLNASSNTEINLTNFSKNLDLFLLSDCNKKIAIGRSRDTTRGKPEKIIYNNLPAGNYYIVVEGGRDCMGDNFTLELKATNCCEITAITNPAIGKDCKTFQLSGSIPESCGAIIIERGFVWALKPDPNLQNGTKIPEFPQGGIGQFGYDLVTNISDTTYYYRAYAVTSSGNIILGNVRSLKSGNCCLSSTEILQVPLYKDIVDNKCKNLQDSSIGIYLAQYNGQLVYFAFHSNYNYFVVTDCKGEVLYDSEPSWDCYKERQDYLETFRDVKLIYSCPGGKSLCYKPNCNSAPCLESSQPVCGCDGITYQNSTEAKAAFVSYTNGPCFTNCNLDLCDENNWLNNVLDSLISLNKDGISIFNSQGYFVVKYGEPTNTNIRGSFTTIIYNCNGKIVQRNSTPYFLLGKVIPFCEFFTPYTQLNFPFPNAKIDTLAFDLKSGEQFDCSNILVCGSVRYGNTANGSNTNKQYLCSYNLMDGKEIIYEFVKKANQSAVFHLSEVVRDLDLFVLSKNDPDFCVKHSSKDGQSYDNIFLEASLPAGTYYVVVDGFNNNTSTYKLTIQCDKSAGFLDCNKAKNISCNLPVVGNTSIDGFSTNQFYGSGSSVYYDGKEVIYKFTSTFDGTIDLLLENLDTDLDVFVLDDCGNVLNPLEFSTEANKEEEAIILRVQKGKSYFIVIDSRADMEGKFTLSLTCNPDIPCNNPPCPIPPPFICQSKIQLFCNEPKMGDTRNSIHQSFRQYGCGGVAKGKEVLYFFELSKAQSVDIFIRNILPGNNLKLIVLDSCNPYTAKCLASGNKSNESNEAIRLNLAKGIYHIYVDGYLEKDASSFEIEIKCVGIECDKNPLTLSFDTSNVNCSYNIEVKPKDGVPPYTYKWSTGETLSKLTGVPPGKYIVTVTDKKLCSKVDSVLVNSSCKPACDTAIKGNTEFGKSNYYKYDCSDHKMDGNEIIYEFDNPSTQNVVISLTDLVQDLDLFLMEYVTPMNPDRCVKSSTRTDGSYESIFVENLPKGKYYIVVEGYNKRESSYTLKIDCPKPRGFLDCANAQNVECNKTYSGNTMLGVANNNYYEGKSPVYYDGKELVYKFVAPQGTSRVKAYLEKLTSDVDFFLVENCGNNVKATRASTESNLSNEVILFSPVAGKTYYFVVDNPKGLEGSFNLRIVCQGCPGCPPAEPIDCTKKTRLDCNKPLPDNNFNGTSGNDSYCTGEALGKEKLYYFEIKTAQEVEIILNKLTKGKNLNIYLIKDCEPDGSCLATGNKSGDADDVIIKNLAAGIYYIWVDGFLETDESTYTIEVRCKDIDCSNSPMNLSFTTSKINCNYNVSVNINSGGIPPFSYKWSNGNTTAQLNNVPPGNYTVTVTDKIFCQKDTFINLPDFRTTKTVKIDTTICFGKSIVFGKNTINKSGTYSETFFVAASCLDSIVTLNVTIAAPLTLPTLVSGANCRNIIFINPAGGKPPYRYSWKDGPTTNPRTNLPAGTYAVTVSDAANCQKDTTFVLVPLELNITQKIDSADCGKANGRIEVVTVNKIKSAVWQDNAPNSLVRENLKPGKYTLTLTDVNGCIKTLVFDIGEKNNCTCTIYSTINPKDPDNQFFHIECWTKDCPNKPNSCLEQIELYIYNRWGNLVYKDLNYKNDWDAPGLPDGVYYYQFRRASDKKIEKGSIAVKRSN